MSVSPLALPKSVMAEIELRINGERRTFRAGVSVEDVLAALAIGKDGIAVEVNRVVIPRALHAGTLLGDGDELEIVTFVGGG